MSVATIAAPGATTSPWRGLLWGLWVIAVAAGLVGVYQRFTAGHLPAGYGSYVPWGLWVALYFHGVGIAGGVYVLTALGHIIGVPGFRHPAVVRTGITLSLACIFPAFMGVWFDLGHMERSAQIFLSPHFSSMMAFNAWMYNAFIIIAALTWFLSFKKDSGWFKPLLCLGAFFSVLFPSQSGAFFGVVDTKPFWHSPLLPMLFLASALTAGAATLLALRALLGPGSHGEQQGEAEGEYDGALRRLRAATMIGLAVYFVFEFAEFSIGLWNPQTHAPAIEFLLYGEYWWMFWIVHLLLGGAIPLALLAASSRKAWFAGAVLVAICFVSARLNVLIPGQAVGEIQGLQEAFSHERLTYIYHATPMEYLVGFFMLAVGMAVFFVGKKVECFVSARQGKA